MKPRHLIAMATMAATCCAAQGAAWRTYGQTLTLVFETEAQAQKAAVEALPLPIGKKVAFSSRWDDSAPDGVGKAEILAECGYKGTFYLNRVDQGYGDGVIRRFRELGGSAGAHTLTHPFLPKIDHNAMFREILANRIAIESCGDSCVSTFTLPFMVYESETDPDMPRKIGECLVRAGLHGGDEVWPDVATRFRRSPREWIGAFTFSIDDSNPTLGAFEENVARGLKAIAANAYECGPHLSLGIHNWQPDLKKFGEIVGTQANHPDWWYCNANEYVAYRLQMHNTGIAKIGVSGKTATFRVARQLPFELGDRVALALRASPGACEAAVDGHALELNADGEFTLPHAAERQLPSRIGAVHNEANLAGEGALKADPTLPGLQAALQVDLGRNELICLLKNTSKESLGAMQLTFRLPLKWKTGVVKEDVAVLKPDEMRRIAIAMGDVEPDPAYEAGAYYLAVQCDYDDDIGPARLHAATTADKLASPTVAADLVRRATP